MTPPTTLRTALPGASHPAFGPLGIPWPTFLPDGRPPTTPPEPPERVRTRALRTVWISDLHLGTPGCQAQALLDFLRELDCDTLYLVGDIVDGWQLRRRWHWPLLHDEVMRQFITLAQTGTRVVFVPGNHDEFARRYCGHGFAGIAVVEDAIHVTADGRRLWVTHGDLFDGVVQCHRWLALLGDSAYGLALELNRHLNSLRARMGLPYWSLSKVLKQKVKRAVSYIADFESAVAHEARRRGAQGVVCGHIHHAELRMIDGALYANDGDWVESLTALVEHRDGRLEILDRSSTAPVARRHAAEAGSQAGAAAAAAGLRDQAMPESALVANVRPVTSNACHEEVAKLS